MSNQTKYCMAMDCLKQPELNLDVQLQNGSVITLSVCKGCILKFRNATVRKVIEKESPSGEGPTTARQANRPQELTSSGGICQQ